MTGTTARLSSVLVAATLLLGAGAAHAQVGRLVSPGPLSRAHASLEGAANCEKCHEPGRRVTADRCLACHRPIAERIRARKGVHREVTEDCVTCHVEHAGRDAELRPFDSRTFNHAAETGFPLEGRHARVACASCHKTRSFLTAQPACATCHADPHKGALGNACGACHPPSIAFKDITTRFDHSRTAFALAGAHRTVPCAKCHVNQVYRGLAFRQCTDCHRTPHRQALGDTCTSCHTQDAWKTQKIDHARTGFPLRGLHASVACVKCHVQPATRVRVKAERCADCHSDPHRGAFAQDCAACHQETGFRRTSFDHSTTRFPLTGRHAALACQACHQNPTTPAASRPGARPPIRVVEFRGLSSACVSCHADVHRGELGTQCEKCHATSEFRLAAYTHPRFPEFFAGQHAAVSCAQCHARGAKPAVRRAADEPLEGWRFKDVSTACASCHRDPHLGQVGGACEACHTVQAPRFAPAGFSHDRSSFRLTGLHRSVACGECHKPETAVFPAGSGTAVRLKGVATACAACHRDPHLGQVASTCETCHSTEGARFAPVNFSHERSSFRLTGRHLATPCASCHKRETGKFPAGSGTAVRFKGMGATCQACHRDPHLGQMRATCETCHSTSTFHLTSYAHKPPAAALLVGAHAELRCEACHKPQQAVFPAGVGLAVRYAGTGTACSGCHQDAHRGAFGATCGSCHKPTSTWRAASRSFHQTASFPLEGRHLTVECAQCHVDGVTRGTPTRCYDCHWIRRQDDRYMTRLGSQCEECHRPTSWTAVRWDHGAQTGMALSSAHRSLGCDGCHKDARFAGTAPSCYSCHQADYQRAANPNHVSAGFPVTCDACHKPSQNSWHDAGGFSHASFFPLVGVHATQPCAACHKNNVYAGTPRTCYGCHKTDYDQTRNPNHASAGFSTTCESCHQPSAADWGGAFNHNSVFPLVGVHATQPCAACHKNNVYAGTPRVCYGCHQADYTRAQNPNHVSAAFPTTCEACHKATDSTWQQAVFNHNTFYPLQGVHATQPCAACHKNNVYQGTPTDCYACHQAAYQNAQNPNHIAAGFPTTCANCHRASDATWQQGTFTHTWFPITSGRHAGIACAVCHTTSGTFAVFSCVNGCHAQSSTNSQHQGVSGYRYDSLACYACHPTGSGGEPFAGALLVASHVRVRLSSAALVPTHAPAAVFIARRFFVPAHAPTRADGGPLRTRLSR